VINRTTGFNLISRLCGEYLIRKGEKRIGRDLGKGPEKVNPTP
jgi:hypothetical protein